MDVFDALNTQRAIRSFRSDPVPEELIAQVIEAATRAPSGANTQPWAFIVVRDQGIRDQLAECAKEDFAVLYENALKRQQPGDPPPFPRLRPMVENFSRIPVLIYPCAVLPPDAPRERLAQMSGSLFPAIQNLLIAARALELGAALTMSTLHTTAEKVEKILQVPSNVHPVAMIPLGYPDSERYGKTSRRPVSEVLHWDRWSDRETTSQVVGHR